MRRLALLVVLALTASTATPAHAALRASAEAPPAESAAIDVSALEQSLQEDELELSSVAVGPAAVRVTTVSELGDGAAVVARMTVDIDRNAIVVDFDSEHPALDGRRYEIKVRQLDAAGTELTATDVATGQRQSFDSDAGEFAALPLVLGIPIAVSVLEALLAATAVVVIAGVTYVAATEAIKAIQRGSSYRHFRAIRRPNGLFLGSGMSLNDAIQWGRLAKDTWSTSEAGAKAVARGVKGANPIGPEIDGSGASRFWHYHPAKRRPAMHAFFGTNR